MHNQSFILICSSESHVDTCLVDSGLELFKYFTIFEFLSSVRVLPLVELSVRARTFKTDDGSPTMILDFPSFRRFEEDI